MDLTQRLRGLAAAHDLILPDIHDQRHTVRLLDLLTVLLKPYLAASTKSENIAIAAPEVMVSESSITSVAMLVHELATNSAKYGALSSRTGRLVLSCRVDGEEVEIVWSESGGHVPETAAQKTGFGRQLKDRIIRQLNGSIARKWTPEGVIITMRMNKARLGK